MQHFNRERVPERVVHAKGSGAHGFFEVTEDVTQWTSASFLSQAGKRTPMFARFSTVAGEVGNPDTVRDPRGFALKLYTEEGNYDLVGNNTRYGRSRPRTPDHEHRRHTSDGVSEPVQERVIQSWSSVDPQLGAEVSAGLGRPVPLPD